MAVDVSNHTIRGSAGNVIYPFLFCKKDVNNAQKQGSAMTKGWKPDIVDYNVIDAEKAEFIYAAADQLLEATIKVSDDREKKCFQFLSILLAAIPALGGYTLLKCNYLSHECSNVPHLFLPCLVMLVGLSSSALMIVLGCIFPRVFHFKGNVPSNLVRNDLCALEIHHMKLSTAIAMQEKIEDNDHSLHKTANWLQRSLLMMSLTPAVALILALVLFSAS